jgi:hypothetical protein
MNHFISFTKTYKIPNVTLLSITHYFKANLIFAMYATSLTLGHTLLCKTIKSKTISEYLQNAANFVSKACHHLTYNSRPDKLTWYDPHINPSTGKTAAVISKITTKVQCWETCPNRHEPLTVDMIKWQALSADPNKPHSLENAMYDWLVIGIYLGPCLTKWAQTDSGITYTTHLENVLPLTQRRT